MPFNETNFNRAIDVLTSEGHSEEEVFKTLDGFPDHEIDAFSEQILADRKIAARKFVPDEATGSDGVVKAAVRGAGKVVTFGQAERLSAGVQAVGQEIGEAIGRLPDDDENFIAEYKKAFAAEKKLSKVVEDENPISSAVGEIGGYFINPFSRFFQKVGQGAKTVKGFAAAAGAEVGAVEGTTGFLNTIARSLEEPEVKFSDIVKEEGTAALIKTGVAVITGGVAAKVLRPTHQKDIKVTLKDLGVKNVQEGIQKIDDVGKGAIEILETAKNGILEEMQDGATGNAIVAQEFVQNLNDTFDSVALRIADNVKKKAPKGIADSLGEFVQSVELYGKQLSTAFGQALEPIIQKTQGKVADAAPIKTLLVDALTKEGSLVVDDAGKFVFTSGDDITKKFFKAILIKDSFTFKELQGLLTTLGPKSAGQATTPGEVAMKSLWGSIRETMKDGAIWGDDVSKSFDLLQKDYTIGLKAMKGTRRAFQKLQEASARAGDDATLFGTVAEVQRNLKQFGKGVDTLNGLSELNNVLDPNQVTLFKETFKKINETYDISKASNVAAVKKTMKDIFNGKLDITAENKLIRNAIDQWGGVTEIFEAVQGTKMASEIHKALLDPFDKTATDRALKWAQTNAKGLLPELKKSLNRAARWHRMGGFNKIIKPKEALRMAKELAEPGEVEALELAMTFNDDIRKIVTDVDLVELLVKQNKLQNAGESAGALAVRLFRKMAVPQLLFDLLKSTPRAITIKEAARISAIAQRTGKLGAVIAGKQQEAFNARAQ